MPEPVWWRPKINTLETWIKEALASEIKQSIDKQFNQCKEELKKLREFIQMEYKELNNMLASYISRIKQAENHRHIMGDKLQANIDTEVKKERQSNGRK